MKTSMAVIVIFISLFFAIGMHFQVAKGNPTGFGPPNPTQPVEDPPTIDIQFPENITYYGSIVPLNVTVTQPISWYVEQYPRQLAPLNTIKSVNCVIDGQQFVLWNGTLVNQGLNQAISFDLPSACQFAALIEAGSGEHTLEVDVGTQVLYYPRAGFFPSSLTMNASQNVTFTVETSLAVSETTVSSIEPPTPTSNYRPLVMVTPTPNPGLTLSPSATHSPNPSPTSTVNLIITPSPSPTQQPIPEPSATPNNAQENFTSTLFITALLVALVIALLVYLRKKGKIMWIRMHS